MSPVDGGDSGAAAVVTFAVHSAVTTEETEETHCGRSVVV